VGVSNYTDTGRTNGTTYYYVITAVDNAANESADSSQKGATPTAGPPSVYDANGLTIAASSGDVVDSVNDSGASNGNFLRYKASSVNDYITFNVSVPATATYTISVKYSKLPYGGICRLAIDGSNQGSGTDVYASSPTLQSVTLGTKSLTAGTHTFKFTSTGQNSSSSGFYIGLDTIILTP
jgi:fibronectin type 3 domain-containing protein